MIRYTLVISTLIFSLGLSGQFTYFNDIHGNSNPEIATNIEVIGDDIFIWGARVIDEYQYTFRKFNDQGSLLGQNYLTFDDFFMYVGVTNSFQRIPDEQSFLYSYTIVDSVGYHGYLMKFNANSDTVWAKYHDTYYSDTNFITHDTDGDGFIIVGSHDVGPGQRGAFVQKVDENGEYLWHKQVHGGWQGIFHNNKITSIDDGYILSGSSGAGASTEGRIEVLDSLGNYQYAKVGQSGIIRGTMRHVVKNNGDIIVAQAIGTEDYTGSSNPLIMNTKMRLALLDLDAQELIVLNDLMEDELWISGSPIKLIEADDGIVILGLHYKEIGGQIPLQSWIMKVDANFQQEWYSELAYGFCSSCTSELYDIVETSDGGYAMVGYYNSSNWNPLQKTWLVKVDACGDLEWQGCELPDGLWENSTSLEEPIRVFPNPAKDNIMLDHDKLAFGSQVSIFDESARLVLTTRYMNDQSINVSSLANGLYSIQAVNQQTLLSATLAIQH